MAPLALPVSLVVALGQLAELTPLTSCLVLGYLLARLLVPVLLIVLAGRSATPTQRVGLVRDYLLQMQPRVKTRRGGGVRRSRRSPCRRRGS
ncbi:hypothetical protein K1T35_48540 (plasmid) [Pseudonocardia sp. DSM 110487]|uniref:hypothetical protein n=1 Tax=Pseudonocardia sp. DSM 110487 TaxID=2865833 RepID=UPI001C69E427|nr:hypothetical protein [Pseudonocardia sp. DSM 110487]QYN41197.1 hypothetical protein K1T35_48540 [Pseudonocardia sp. DSM 110487]